MDIKEICGEDGLWRCSVCGAVTRRSVEFLGKRDFRIRCPCQKAEDAKEAELERQEAEAKAARELRKMSMMDEKLGGRGKPEGVPGGCAVCGKVRGNVENRTGADVLRSGGNRQELYGGNDCQ